MKLLYCRSCNAVFSLALAREKTCECGAVRGAYEDDGLHAWYSGEPAVPLGLMNASFLEALATQPAEGWGKRFEAFVIPRICPTFQRRRT
jgi:hypothetical protein